MKVRIGFVTNSSSTNFLIMSKEELTEEYLYKILGFEAGSKVEHQARELCRCILEGTYLGVKYENWDRISYGNVQKTFGKYVADKYKVLTNDGYLAYVGYTSSGDGTLTDFFTTDTFEYEKPGFYINGRMCMW